LDLHGRARIAREKFGVRFWRTRNPWSLVGDCSTFNYIRLLPGVIAFTVLAVDAGDFQHRAGFQQVGIFGVFEFGAVCVIKDGPAIGIAIDDFGY
jgi:hypothetical protein